MIGFIIIIHCEECQFQISKVSIINMSVCKAHFGIITIQLHIEIVILR